MTRRLKAGVIYLARVRVYKLAKEIGISSKELIAKLKELSIEVGNHMSTLEREEADFLLELYKSDEEEKKDILQVENGENIDKKDKKDINEEGLDEAMKTTEHEDVDKRKKKNSIEKQGEPVITIDEMITVKDFSEKINKTANEVIASLIKKGIMASINQQIDFETAEAMAKELGFEVKKITSTPEEEEDIIIVSDDEEDLEPRPPVVTVMGHVDHGKTSLLDAIRETHVTTQEAGGITQHIGASEVVIDGKKIVFLDTPGHEAFTTMRARGAKVTDIAVLVVAADDGVMQQTIEAINHAKAAEVPIIVAINKIDKPSANPDKVKQELADFGILIEEWGGDVISIPVSAHNKTNIDTLLEMILLVSEMEELKANPNRKAIGIVVEAELDRGRGPVATVLVQNGTLRVGDSVVIGTTYGRIRAMINDKGKRVQRALPATAVEITGFSGVPEAGDQMVAVEDDRTAKLIASRRIDKIKEEQMKKAQRISLDALYSQVQEGSIKELNIIIKADVQGSVEAMRQSIEKLSSDQVTIKVIHGGVGAITESDIMLASASNAIIIGFNVRPTSSAVSVAKEELVDIRTYRVIYKALEDIEAAIKGMLDPEYKEVELGKAEVRATFRVPNIGIIAGCYVTEGRITRNGKVRLVRDGIVIHEGNIGSLRRFKDDVREVAAGYECGIGIDNFNDVKEGDIFEVYHMEEIKV